MTNAQIALYIASQRYTRVTDITIMADELLLWLKAQDADIPEVVSLELGE